MAQPQDTFPLTITSQDWDSRRQRFVKKLNRNFDFTGWQMGVTSMSMYNSTQNIRAAFNNNRITVRFPAHFTKDPYTKATLGSPVDYWDVPITFDDGWYLVEDIVAFIWNKLYLAGMYVVTTDGESWSTFINVEAVSTSYGSRLNLPAVQADASYSLPPDSTWSFLTGGNIRTMTLTIPSGSGFGTLIGFAPGVYGNATEDTAIASTICPVINLVSGFVFGCNLVQNLQTSPPDAFFSTALLVANGEQITPSIGFPQYVTCKGSHSEIELTIYDQSGNIYTPFDVEFLMWIMFQKPR